MIVVDTNTIACLYLSGERSKAAEELLLREPNWSELVLWRSEFRNVLAPYLSVPLITADKKIPIPLFFVSLIFVLTFQKIFSQEPLRIMPLGNSITFDARIYESRGDWEKISYRYTLHQLLTGDQFKIDMVGSRRAGWAYFDDCDNAGLSLIHI